jgi:energy-coupling factor transport system ATP-binding protein
MVFQNPDNQIIAGIVEEDVAFGPENLGIPPAEIRTRVDDALAAVRMSRHTKSAPHNLSGGQKQRVAIAGVLAMRPSVIVLDESTAMLDPQGRREVMKTVRRLNRDHGITVICITHFMEEAATADRVIIMQNGNIAADATPRALFSRVGYMRSLGLSAPAVTKLAHALKTRGHDIPTDALTVDELLQTVGRCPTPRQGSTLPCTPNIESRNCAIQNGGQGAIAPCGGAGGNAPAKLSLKNLTHIYNVGTPFEKTAIRDISLDIYEGEIVAIIGHTGSGKSTLVQHFNALLRPSGGQVFLDGADIYADKQRTAAVRGRVGLVFQYPEHQLFEVSVWKDVAFGPARLGFSEEEIAAATKQALEIVGLGEDVWEKSPFELSGGQKRRAAIAGVIAMRPQVLVLDEPAAGLDPQGRAEILHQLKQMQAGSGMAMVLVSHSMDDASRIASRIIVMNDGCIAMDGATRDVFARGEELRGMGLDVPAIAQVTGALGLGGIFDVDEAADAIMGIMA